MRTKPKPGTAASLNRQVDDLNRGVAPLKAAKGIEELTSLAALIEEPTEQIELVESEILPATFFTGVETYLINGIAHLLFYTEQVYAGGGVEHVVVARMLAPVPLAKAALGRAVDTMRSGRRHPDGVTPN